MLYHVSVFSSGIREKCLMFRVSSVSLCLSVIPAIIESRIPMV